jgi:hypothetical protein
MPAVPGVRWIGDGKSPPVATGGLTGTPCAAEGDHFASNFIAAEFMQ